jgi:O-succinylhomoserine sulfhydrylase
VAGGKTGAFKVAKALRLVDVSNNLGDSKSLLTHPATTTHQRMTPEARLAAGVSDGMLRIAVGLEDAEDVCDDLAQALATI